VARTSNDVGHRECSRRSGAACRRAQRGLDGSSVEQRTSAISHLLLLLAEVVAEAVIAAHSSAAAIVAVVVAAVAVVEARHFAVVVDDHRPAETVRDDAAVLDERERAPGGADLSAVVVEATVEVLVG